MAISARTERTELSTTADGSRGDDWAATVADKVERVVGSIRAKTADPLERVVRVVVYGVLAAIVGGAAAVLAAALLLRLLVILTDLVFPDPETWLAHLLIGAIFAAVGLFMWRRRTVKTTKV